MDKKFKSADLLKAPRVEVLHIAAQKILNRPRGSITLSVYSCNAISSSLNETCTWHLKYELGVLYKQQYEMWVRSQNGGRLPRWWNNLRPYTQNRYDALMGFANACVEAGKKE